MKWRRAQQGPISGSLVDYLESLIEAEMENNNTVKVCVGTDSQKRGKGYNFATVILVEIKAPKGTDKLGKTIYQGKGAMVISASKFEKNSMSLNERMMKEVEASMEVAYEIYPLLDLYDIALELHADINQNPKHGSNVALKSAIGYMSGIPCTIRVKPDAYAASTGADKIC